MPFTILLFLYRNPNLSPSAFKAHYETTLIPLLRSIAGDTFPTSHTRRYIRRSEPNPDEPEAEEGINAKYSITVLLGKQTDFEYDAFAELIFDDEVAFKSFMAVVGKNENAKKLAEDEEKFLDRSRMKAVVVGETIATTKE